MTSTTTGFNWAATHLKFLSGNIDVISRFQMSKISSQVIVVWSTMQPYVHSKGLDKLMVVAVWVPWSNVICHSWTCHWSGNERRNQGLVRKHITAKISIRKCLWNRCLSKFHSLRSRICCDIKPFISGLSQPVPRRAPSTSGSFGGWTFAPSTDLIKPISCLSPNTYAKKWKISSKYGLLSNHSVRGSQRAIMKTSKQKIPKWIFQHTWIANLCKMIQPALKSPS